MEPWSNWLASNARSPTAKSAGGLFTCPSSRLPDTEQSKKGSKLFDKIGCTECHVRTLTTAPAGTKINGDTYSIPEALGGKTFYPYSDFLLHDVGTGDGIVVPMVEHYGRNMYQITWKNFSPGDFQSAQNKIRTAPL